MSIRELDINIIKHAIDNCCRTEEECGECKRAGCLIGFSKIAVDYAKAKNTYNIPQGPQMIPQHDTKVFYKEDLNAALLKILLQCQDCRDNHEEECIVNCTRRAVELALIGDYIPYKGSAVAYLMEISKKDRELGRELLEKYKGNKG